ncbi:hypothetical protein [Floricoccus penangensis]|uniref:hypothetical protein n=1 Tax=Floricoccus penangensis TaxID=1859475 RepID=UPI00203FF58A|nr:hypothetical protein [Floricoccus penangensis]URZ87185.1 hypothetical protein KIW23_08890 [Floricoccus penangensis]
MSTSKWIDLALKYGGYMEMDKVLLSNSLENLSTDAEKLAFVTPPASVVNAYFSELYQKKDSEAALDYFLDLSKALGNFNENPSFQQEGQTDYPSYRFIRLNLQGMSYGFIFKNETGEAIAFPENSEMLVKEELVLQLATLFPSYAVSMNEGKSMIELVPVKYYDEEPLNRKVLPEFPSSVIIYYKSYLVIESDKLEEIKKLSKIVGQDCDKVLQYSQEKLRVFLKS